MNYLQLLVEDIHSTIVSTIGEDGHPQVRAADMMLWDEGGVYFLTAEGKAFYRQLMAQGFVALAGVKDGRAVSLRGKVHCIGCGMRLAACPQSCIDVSAAPAVTDQHRCLHCGSCVPVCPEGDIVYA